MPNEKLIRRLCAFRPRRWAATVVTNRDLRGGNTYFVVAYSQEGYVLGPVEPAHNSPLREKVCLLDAQSECSRIVFSEPR